MHRNKTKLKNEKGVNRMLSVKRMKKIAKILCPFILILSMLTSVYAMPNTAGVDSAIESVSAVSADPDPTMPLPRNASVDTARITLRIQHDWMNAANSTRWASDYTGADALSIWWTDDGSEPSKTNGTRIRVNPTVSATASNGVGNPRADLLDYKGGTTYKFVCFEGDTRFSATYSYLTNLNAPRLQIDNNIAPQNQNNSLRLTSGLYKRSDVAGGIKLYTDTPTAKVYYRTEATTWNPTVSDFSATSIDALTAQQVVDTGVVFDSAAPISAASLDELNGLAIRAATFVEGLTPQVSLYKIRVTDDDKFITLKADKDGNYLIDIDTFVQQLTFEEKLMITGGVGGDPIWQLNGYSYPYESNNGGAFRWGGPAGGTPAQPRFNIPSLVLADGPAGLRMWKNATVWMSPAGMGASWNKDLMYEVGERFAVEGEHYAVDIALTPMINIQRNPVGGRNFEFYSEDPYLTGYTTGAYVSGMQENGLAGNLKVIALNDYETGRGNNGAYATERTMMEVYLRAHQLGLRESNAYTFMTGYNRINSVRCDSNKWMISDVLRDMWGFTGFVMTDWSSDPGPASIEAQVDMIQSAARNVNNYRTWLNADVAGRMPILNRSVKNVLGVLVKTFAFQGAYGVLQPDGTYADGFRIDGRPTVGLTSQDIGQRNLAFGGSVVQKDSAKINKQLADEAVVLLKNENNVLPLKGNEKVALVSSRLAWNDFFNPRWYGDSASIGDLLLQGTGSAQVRFSNSTQDYSMTLVEALTDRGFNVVDWKIDFGALGGNNEAFLNAFYDNPPAQGGKKYVFSEECAYGMAAEVAAYTYANSLPLDTARANAKAAAEAAAAAADVGIFVITRVAGEDGDLNPTTYQIQPKELLVYYEYETAFRAANKPLIALINVGGTMSTTMIRGGEVNVGTGENAVSRTTAGANVIMDIWNPGAAGGEAIADILKGTVNPSGKLAQTFIVNFNDSPSIKMFTDYNNRTDDKENFPTYPGNGYNNNAYYADGVYVGYRFFETNPELYDSMVAYPFGYGLSYTTFAYSDLKLDRDTFFANTKNLNATVTVTNTGAVAGKEIVQLYLSANTWQAEGRPKNELRAYGKTEMLQPGESQTLTLSINPDDLMYYDDGTPDNFIGNPITRTFWSSSNLPFYGLGKGWTVADETEFTITIRTNSGDASKPNQPIEGLQGTFTYIDDNAPSLELKLDKAHIDNGEYFNVKTAVSRTIESNVVVLDYEFDKDIVEYANYTLAAGVEFISSQPTDNGIRFTLMVQDYQMQNLIDVMFQAKKKLDETEKLFAAVGQFVVIGMEGKEILVLCSDYIIDPPDFPPFDLIYLSNAIDAFGTTKADGNWPDAKRYDFDQNGIIDILDIVFAASNIK